MLLSRSGLTRLVDRLEREGYLERCSCAHDARGAFAVLTPAGREKVEAARVTHLAGVRQLFLSHFSDEGSTRWATRWIASSAPAAELELHRRALGAGEIAVPARTVTVRRP